MTFEDYNNFKSIYQFCINIQNTARSAAAAWFTVSNQPEHKARRERGMDLL